VCYASSSGICGGPEKGRGGMKAGEEEQRDDQQDEQVDEDEHTTTSITQ